MKLSTLDDYRDAWKKADEKLAEAFARYNNTVSGKYGDLYGDDSEGNKILLTYPVRFQQLTYYVTEDFPMVYKYNESSDQYRQSKTAYKDLKRCEQAIDRAIDHRESINDEAEQLFPNWYKSIGCEGRS